MRLFPEVEEGAQSEVWMSVDEKKEGTKDDNENDMNRSAKRKGEKGRDGEERERTI